METKKKIAVGIGGLLIVGMASSIAIDMLGSPTSRASAAPVVFEEPQTMQYQSVYYKADKDNSVPSVVIPLSYNATDMINALETVLLSTVKTQAINAEIIELEGQQKLDELKENALYGNIAPEPVVVVQQKQAKPSPSVIERLQIKSIISNPNNMIAFIDIAGQLIPVKKGELVEDAKVHNITRNTVVFKRGNKLTTKYIKAAPIKVVIEKESGNVRQ
ncbi:hypothetical protein [Aliivibrio wodanis]|uniref:hypothetical protein n=1 Tax=Aliivibrio wodanis TaxID=80852 RepID=UPI00406C331A